MDGSIARLRNAVHKPGQSWCCMTFPPALCATSSDFWMRQPRSASACGMISRRRAYPFSMGGSFGRSPTFSRRRARPNWGVQIERVRWWDTTLGWNSVSEDMPKARTIAFFLAVAASLAAHNNGALAETQPCRSMEYERNAYTICEVDLRKHTVRLYWKRADGTPYGFLSTLPRALEGEADRLLFATNAGMFDPALKPVGLYVEQGRELVHVNTKSGYGNFHLKPNGVFYISVDRAAVAETRTFLAICCGA